MNLTATLCLAASLTAQPSTARDHKWWRRAAAAAVCAAGAFDSMTTFAAYNRDPSGHEESPWLADSRGKPSPLKFSLVKGGICAASIVLVETRRVPDAMVYAATIPLTIPSVVTGVRNMGVPALKTPGGNVGAGSK